MDTFSGDGFGYGGGGGGWGGGAAFSNYLAPC